MPTSGGAAGLARLYPPSPLRQEGRRLQEPSRCSSLLQFCLLSPAAAPAQEGSAASAGCAQVQLQLQQAPPTKLHSQNMTGAPHFREVSMDSNLKTGQNKKKQDTLGVPPFARSAVFFNIVQKGGGDQTHVQKICCKFCMILKAFWQHKIDIKRLFKGRNVSIWG